MMEWYDWLANASPPWGSYRAYMAGQLFALKMPWCKFVVIGEVYCCLLDKIALHAVLAQAKEVCGSINSCAVLESVLEGAIHAVR